MSKISNTPGRNGQKLREVARVVLPANQDLDALPLYVDGPVLKEGQTAAGTEVAEHPDDLLSRRSMRIRPGRRVSFGSYFNAFPASYWRRWTTAEKVVLSVGTQGSGSLIVYRSNARGISQRVEDRRVRGGEVNDFELTLAPFGDGGWYWFDLIADDEGMTLEGASWSVVDDRPAGTVTLGVTTFNRPDYCVNTIRTIAGADGLDDVLDELIIVDQGNKLVEDEDGFDATEDAMGGKLRVIRQGNLGGSGGFSRNMYEVVQGREDGSKSDYVLILDDDILLETEGVLRAVAFADFCRKPTIVGGHMFDMYNRPRLNGYAEVINRYRFLWGPIDDLGGLDFSEAGLRSRPTLHRRWDADYNGWWMCLIPRVVLEDVGLSLPVFIKWDDSEYSLRAAEAGYPTVSLPGAAVWHVSWMDKDDAVDWQAYFHERNRLIAALLHSPFPRGGRMIRESFNVDTKHTISMQYYAASTVLMAIEDVLRGPEHLHGMLGTKMPEIRALKDEFTDAQISKDPGDFPAARRSKPPKRIGPPKPPTYRALLPWAAKTVVKQIALPVRDLAKTHPEEQVAHQDGKWYHLSTLDSAVVSNADGTGASWYKRDPQAVRDLLARSARLHAELFSRWEALAKQYREALPQITSPQSWGQTFQDNPPVEK
ncbi:glycosyltransferase family 2 protein [Kocuria coralli]|uniref:Glycosyltransferase family 2 protein n=1 Tax=Kocuria coralli TaxID=1461025 RepID=A0A5J5L464_9MICC|nr:glycosyltransferase [Kocuria coralli]KAA9395751.1 glycosyltransferase family 2 protein [Kocuria coralli]